MVKQRSYDCSGSSRVLLEKPGRRRMRERHNVDKAEGANLRGICGNVNEPIMAAYDGSLTYLGVDARFTVLYLLLSRRPEISWASQLIVPATSVA